MDLATGAMGSLVLKLGKLLMEEYKLQKGVKEDIRFIQEELMSMQTALRKIGDVPRDQVDVQVKLWAGKVRDLSYRMEDIIDKFLVRVDGPEPTAIKPGKLKRLMKKMRGFFAKGKTRHEIAEEIKGMKALVQEVADRRDRYEVKDVVPTPAGPNAADPRLPALYNDPKDLVGIDDSLDDLTKMLTGGDGGESEQLKIISVFGFGGLGKTTLAKAVYDTLKEKFQCSAFISVGQKPSIKKVLNDILFGIENKKHLELDEMQLIDLLKVLLKKKRYLIVIDDIWDIETWELVKLAIADDNESGSKIVTTTRVLKVATTTGDVYRLNPLSRDLSIDLFHKRLFGDKIKKPNHLPAEVYNKILIKCGGAPLAIIAIASLLVGKPVDSWSKIYNSIGFGNDESLVVDNMRKILLFSYYDLPSHLKTCLLHLSLYPEDHFIEKDSLIWKWVAEGFIQEEQGVGLFEIGERYFNELINRSMILSVETPPIGVIIGCYVHDMVFDMICLLSKEENFVTILGGNEQYDTTIHSNARRLAIGHRSNPLASTTSMPQVRTFNAMCRDAMLPSLSCFEFIRALALEGEISNENNNSCLAHLGKLVHLRYLGLGMANVSELPREIGDLKYLETLVLGSTRLEELPQSVGQLSQLKRLHAYNSSIIMPDWIGNLKSLEELHMGSSNRSANFLSGLGKLAGLRKLRIKRLFLLSEDSIKSWAESLVKLQKIEVIDIGQVVSSGYDDTTWCWGAFAPPPQLRVLHMSYRQPGMLARINCLLLPNLSHLSVYVETPDLEIFGTFQELVTLQLEMDGIHHHDVMGSVGAFPMLRFFKTDAMPGRFVEGDMPSLESLEFRIELGQDSMGGELNFDFACLGNLPLLEKVTVHLFYAPGVCADKAEKRMIDAIDIHPNRPILDLKRCETPWPDYVE